MDPAVVRLDDLLSDAMQVLADSGYNALAEGIRLARARLEGKPDPPIQAIAAYPPDDAVIASSSALETITHLGSRAALMLRGFDSAPYHRSPDPEGLIRGLRAHVNELPSSTICLSAPALVRHLSKTVDGLVASTDVTMIGQFRPDEHREFTPLGVARSLDDPAGFYVAHIRALHQRAQTARVLLGGGLAA